MNREKLTYYSIIVVTLIIILIVIRFVKNNIITNVTENFNEQNGQLCFTCENKTMNQCLECFNCGFCVDQFGNGKCIGGDAASGPYNNESCRLWYQSDPYVLMKQRNANYKCSYGPRSSNRLIGV